MIFLLTRDERVPLAKMDQCKALVVIADTEEKARTIAQAAASEYGDIHSSMWTDPATSTCESLEPDGKDRVVLIDVLESY